MRTDVFWTASILLAASLAVSSLVPQMVGYVTVLGVYVAFVAWLVVTGRFTVVYHWAVATMVGLIWAVFALTTALAPTVAEMLRLGAFTVITGTNLFVVPAVIDRATFHDVLAYVASAFVLLGLPTAVGVSYGIDSLAITPWGTSRELFGIVIHTPMSIFDNPNYLSGVSAIGTVAAGAGYARSRTPLAAGLVGLNILGVVLAGGRAALLGLVATGGLYAVYRVRGRAAMAVVVALGSLAMVVGLGMAFGILPGPNAVAQINLGDRRATWTAAYEAVLDRPVIGWGPGNDSELLAGYLRDSVDVTTTHNSYIRLFLISGILGGGAYLALSGAVIAIGAQNARSETVFTFLLLVMFLIFQIFEGMTIFGLSLLSTLGALFVGYVQSSSPVSRIINIAEVRRRIVGYTRQGT